MLTDENGNLRPFNKFKDSVAKVFTTYNKTYLQTEYNHAIATSQMAAQWRRYEQDAEDFPYLQYITAGDDNVRPAHAALNGTTLPLKHSFWAKYYPPNDWVCRCDVVQLTRDQARKRGITPDDKAGNLKAEPANATYSGMFARNPGQDPYWFAGHNYFDSANEQMLQSLVNERRYRTEYNDQSKWEKVVPYNPETGGYVVLHKKHGTDELPDNLMAAKVLAKAGRAVELLERIEIKGEKGKGIKSADSSINHEIWEIKAPRGSKSSTIQNLLREARHQSPNICLHLHNPIEHSLIIEGILAAIRNDVKGDPTKLIKTVQIMYKQEGKIEKFDRSQIEDGSFKEMIRQLY